MLFVHGNPLVGGAKGAWIKNGQWLACAGERALKNKRLRKASGAAGQLFVHNRPHMAADRATNEKRRPEAALGSFEHDHSEAGSAFANAARRFEIAPPKTRSYLILVSLNSTCFLATGSYLRNDSLSVLVRLFLLVT